MNDYAITRAAEARRLTALAGLLATLACLAALVPAVERTANLVVFGACALTLIALVLRVVLRWVRERREDCTDALTAARWRAENAPHLLTDTDRARLAHDSYPAVLLLPVGREVS